MVGFVGGLLVILIIIVIKMIGMGPRPWVKPCPKSTVPEGHPLFLHSITDNIYLGNWHDSIDMKKLQHNNIKYILTLNTENKHTDANLVAFKKNGIKTKYIDINDSISANILQHVNPCIHYIKSNAPSNVLVHCSMGISRSASIVIAYLIKEKNMTYSDALRYVKKKRHIINPNPSFAQQLRTI